jgi:hypothetical protein
MSSPRISWRLFLFSSKFCPISLSAQRTDSLSRPGKSRKEIKAGKAIMMYLPDIPVALKLSHACKFTLLIGRAVSQLAGEHIDDFSGRGGVVIEAAGVDAPHVSSEVVSRGEI